MVPIQPTAVRLAGLPAHTVVELAVTEAGTVHEAGTVYVLLVVAQRVADEVTTTVCVLNPLVNPVNVKGNDTVAADTLKTVELVPTVTVTLLAVVLVNETVPVNVY